MTTTQAVQTSLALLQKLPFFARGGKVVLYKNGTDSLHVSVFARKRIFFSPVWPTVHTCLLKTVTENVSFKNRSRERKFLRRRFAVLMWMGENKEFEKTIACTSRCWIPVNVHAPIKDCTEPFFTHYCVFVWTRIFGTRKKVSVFRQIRILYIQANGRKMKKKTTV